MRRIGLALQHHHHRLLVRRLGRPLALDLSAEAVPKHPGQFLDPGGAALAARGLGRPLPDHVKATFQLPLRFSLPGVNHKADLPPSTVDPPTAYNFFEYP